MNAEKLLNKDQGIHLPPGFRSGLEAFSLFRLTEHPARLKRFLLLLFLSLIITATTPVSMAEEFYSFIDESGVQVFTNIPPASGETPEDNISTHQNQAQLSRLSTGIAGSDSRKFDSIIDKYASYYELDPSLIHSIIETESGFNPNAVSSKGARGLMQLMPATANRLGVKNIFDPEQNIHAGVRHFRSLMDMFNNNLDLSLAAYNAGENLVRRLGQVPRYEETINYVRSVTRRYRERRENVQGPGNPAPTYRYVDATGVLHLTNIPPTR